MLKNVYSSVMKSKLGTKNIIFMINRIQHELSNMRLNTIPFIQIILKFKLHPFY